MHWHEFVFSNQRKIRYLRHIVFWVTWWLYFTAVYYMYQESRPGITPGNYNYANLNSLIILKSFLLLSLQGLACYIFIYFILPRYLIKIKWVKLTGGILLLGIFLSIAGYLLYRWVFPLVNSILNYPAANKDPSLLWSSISIGLLNTPKVIAAAAAIKLTKYWWLKQEEKANLEKEKINTELQLLKAQIHPGFLFNALNNIYAYSLARSPKASEMLLKLSDLLSYMLYECDKPLVPVQREIEMMKEYMKLEKIRHHENLEMELSVKGNPEGKKIAPFLLLPFIENSFKYMNDMTEPSWINMEIRIEGNCLSMKLINGIAHETAVQPELQAAGSANVQKRLTLLYPGKHELKMSTEQEMFIVFLSIQLDEQEETAMDHFKIKNTEPLVQL